MKGQVGCKLLPWPLEYLSAKSLQEVDLSLHSSQLSAAEEHCVGVDGDMVPSLQVWHLGIWSLVPPGITIDDTHMLHL